MRIGNRSYVVLLALTLTALSACDRETTSLGPDATDSPETTGDANGRELRQIAYIKASDTAAGDEFGNGGTSLGDSVALSDDGSTLAVGAPLERSASNGVNGDRDDNSLYGAGAVYVFTRGETGWTEQAYVKASNPGFGDNFGANVALSADGNTMAAFARFEGSAATGIDGNQNDDSIPGAGAIYLFTREGITWSQQAYIKPSNTGEPAPSEDLWSDGDQFGYAMDLSADGSTLAVGAIGEDSATTGVNGDESDNSATGAGAVYLFTRGGDAWTQQAYIKASNAGIGHHFGVAVSLSAGGEVMAVGSFDEGGSGVPNLDPNLDRDSPLIGTGAVYVFERSGDTWSETAKLKTANMEPEDSFGVSVAISGDGKTIAGGALDEDGLTTGVNSTPVPDADVNTFAGAAYVFVREGETENWTQQAYIKSTNISQDDWFGSRLALSGDGNTLAVGSQLEDSVAQGIDSNQNDDSAIEAGAVYFFTRSGDTWTQLHYVKGARTEAYDEFGSSIALSADGSVMAVGARGEDSAATGINGNQDDNSARESGAVYLFSY